MPQLLARNGPEAGRRYELRDGRYVLGRHPECQILIDVGAVSRQHCVISVEGNACYAEDLKSRNGTFVNGFQLASKHRPHGRGCDSDLRGRYSNFMRDTTFCTPSKTAHLAEAISVTSQHDAVMVDDSDSDGSQIMSRLDANSSVRQSSHWKH